MPIGKFVEYEDANAEVRAVYDDIMATRGGAGSIISGRRRRRMRRP